LQLPYTGSVGLGNTTNTAVLPYGTCQLNSYFSEDFRAKNQFIDRVNELTVGVFKLNVDNISVQLGSYGATAQLGE